MKRFMKGSVLIALAAFMWSLQGVLGKANTWGSFSLVGVRAVFATITLGLTRGDFRLPKRPVDWLAGSFVALTALLFLVANNLTSAANAIILQYTMPLFVMLLGMLFLHKKPTCGELVVSLFVLAGIFLCVFGSAGASNLLGDILALLSALTWAGVFSAGKLLGSDAKDYSYTGNILCILLLAAVPFDPEFSFAAPDMLAAAGMGVSVGLGYSFFARGMRQNVQPTTAAIISNIEPVANPIWVLLFLGEIPTPLSLIGFAVVLISITIYSTRIDPARNS